MVVAVTVAKAVTKAVVDAALHAHALSVRVPPPPFSPMRQQQEAEPVFPWFVVARSRGRDEWPWP